MKRLVWALFALALAGGCAGAAPTSGFETTELVGHDGLTLAAREYGAGDTAIVLSHMAGPDSNQADWQPMADHLAAAGFRVLTFNRPGVCNADGTECSDRRGGMQRGAADVVAAVDYLRNDGVRRVFAGGASMGAMASLAAAELDPTIDGVFFFAGALRAGGYDFDEADIALLDVPLLLVSATEDPYSGALAVERLAEWSNASNTTLLVESDLHGTDVLAAGGEPARRVMEGVVHFMAE